MKLQTLETGGYYHFYNRGNNKENLFKQEENYYYFLKLMSKHLTPVCDIYAYCLLPNHFHFVFKIKTSEELPENIKKGNTKLHQPFSNLFNAYTKAINKKYKRTGSLFQKHPKRIKINSEEYLKNLTLYVNTNSSHHSISDFESYQHSSYSILISDKPSILKRDNVILLFDGLENFKYLHRIKQVKIIRRNE